MHFYIAVSTFYIGFLIYRTCVKKPAKYFRFDEQYNDICPYNHFLARILLMRFFSGDENYERLRKIYDNNLLPKMIKIVEENQDVYIEYKEMERQLSPRFFTYENDLKIPYEFNDTIIDTNLPTLNFIRWFILSDYFLYFDNIEDKKEQ